MNRTRTSIRASLRVLTLVIAFLVPGLAAVPVFAGDAEALRLKYMELRDELHDQNNTFHQPVHVDSSQTGDSLRGDVYAVLQHPFADFSAAMKASMGWCDILILPFNTKYCHAADSGGETVLLVRIGRKSEQPVEEADAIEFSMQQAAATAGFFESRLSAPAGPLGTRDYRIVVSAVPLDGDRTFMLLSYSYGFGTVGRIAMNVYLATVGANRVGFTVTGRDPRGQPTYIAGVRGAIERNVIRYYLAIDAHLTSLSVPEQLRLDKRIETWFDSTERFPRQLREMDRSTYVAMKRFEAKRQLGAVR